MATITRPTKAATGTGSYGSNTVLASSELNADLDTVYTEINGELNNANIKAAAAIELSKLDGYSDSSTEQDTELSPGIVASRVAATTAAEEIQQLRYALSRLSGYVNAEREAGSGLVGVPWIEPPFLGENLIRNASFGTVSDSGTGLPDGWSAVGTVVSVVADADTAMGLGLKWTIQPSADTEGVTYTLGELRASTKYLIVVRGGETAGNLVISTTGADAASNFRNVSKGMSGSSQANYAFVVQTDATPTDIVLKILASGATATGVITYVACHELSSEPLGQAVVHSAAMTVDATQALTAGAGDTVAVSQAVHGPPGHIVKISAYGSIIGGGGGSGDFKIKRATTQLGNTQSITYSLLSSSAVSMTVIDTAPAAGANTYNFTAAATTANATFAPSCIVAEVIPLR
jgi:hypothetical protein